MPTLACTEAALCCAAMLTAQRTWRPRELSDDLALELEHELGVSALCARLLALRGIEDADQGRRFLAKQLKDCHPPEAMRGMDRAAQRLAQAIEKQERILVHGDYDVDGSTAATLLKRFCQACSHDAIAWIPDRRIDGYGLSEASFQAVQEHQAQLMITVDCGIADHGWAARIEATGCTVIITDHHLPGAELPQCWAICNPNQPGCDYPDKGLAGVGVAWKLAWATARILSGADKVTDRLRHFLLDALGLVAIGTVADCAPLDRENRILVHHGLLALAQTGNPGLRAMLAHCRLDEAPLQADDVGWKIGPLLNASGRVGSALRNVELLCTPYQDEADTILAGIISDNEERRRLTTHLCTELLTEIDSNPAYTDRQALVFAGDAWHPGVVGIVASRLVERYGKPCAVIGIVDGIGKGSLRTIPGVHLGQAIEACREHLLAGGGHAMAAGISIDPPAVPAFQEAFEAHICASYPGGIPRPATDYDTTAHIAEVAKGFYDELQALAPFGTGNSAPVLRIDNCRFVTRPDIFGRAGKHLRGALAGDGGAMQPFIAWSVGERLSALCHSGACFDFLLKPEINHWRGQSQQRLLFVDGVSR